MYIILFFNYILALLFICSKVLDVLNAEICYCANLLFHTVCNKLKFQNYLKTFIFFVLMFKLMFNLTRYYFI